MGSGSVRDGNNRTNNGDAPPSRIDNTTKTLEEQLSALSIHEPAGQLLERLGDIDQADILHSHPTSRGARKVVGHLNLVPSLAIQLRILRGPTKLCADSFATGLSKHFIRS